MAFSRPIDDRYFEDYVEGDVHTFGSIAVEADEIIAFAKRFDPQRFHTDPEAAKQTPFGGLIASGWHTAGLMMRLYVEHYLTHVASLASPASTSCAESSRCGRATGCRYASLFSKLRRQNPSRIVASVTSFTEVFNQAGDVVMNGKGRKLCRPAAAVLTGCRNGAFFGWLQRGPRYFPLRSLL